MSNFFDSFQHIVLTTCPWCGKATPIYLTSDQYKRYNAWNHGEGLIQNVLSDVSPDNREMLKTGICPSCWDTIRIK